MMSDLAALLTDRPKIHGGRTVDMGIHPDLAGFLDVTLKPEHVTLETGCGLSTLVMLRASVGRHISVCPVPDEFDAIREQCSARGISSKALEPVIQKSEAYFPTASLPALDLVLIDGDHAFPIPFLDWYYTADRLKVGGFMVLDDTNIASCLFLADFMSADAKWRGVIRSHRFSVYEKIAHPIHGDHWASQAYLWNTYPSAGISIKKAKPPRPPRTPGSFERAMANLLPWRFVQKPLLNWLDWPRRN